MHRRPYLETQQQQGKHGANPVQNKHTSKAAALVDLAHRMEQDHRKKDKLPSLKDKFNDYS
jgi:hypothetical protein